MRSRSATLSTAGRRLSEPGPSPTASTSTAQAPIGEPKAEKRGQPSTHPRPDEAALENAKEHFGMGHKLKRIFIGPSFDGMSDSSSWMRKGKQKEEPHAREHDAEDDENESVWEDEGSSESDGSSKWERTERKRKLARGVRRRRNDTSEWSHSTAMTPAPTRSRRPSVHDWKGNSFEIGQEVREMVERREKRLRSEREARDRQGLQREEESKFLKMHMRGRTNSSATTTSRSLQSGADSFVTARSHSPTSAPPPSPAAFQLNQPPLHIDDKYPELTQTLCRRSSNPPPLKRSTSDTPAILLSAQPTSPIRSILRSKDVSPLNGSALADVQPPSSTPASPLLEVPKSFLAVPPRLLKPPQLPRREASNSASVRFPDFPSLASAQSEEPPTGDQPPAPPQEVLSRPAPEAKATEHKLKDPRPFLRAAADKMLHRKKRGDEVLRKERMLVRDDWSHREDLPKSYDEHTARKYPSVSGNWEELAVVWRPGRIELWGEYKFNLAASLAGSKKLRAVIPLQPRKTQLSIYSSVDLVFCLTHRPLANSFLSAVSSRKSVSGDDDKTLHNPHHSKTKKRAYTHLNTSGTNIFLFRARTIPTAKSWIWSLFRELGGQIPRTLEISVPALGAKVRVPVPVDLPEPEDADIGARVTEEDREGEGYRLLKARTVVDACVEQLGKVGDWREIGEEAKALGATFRLAWRRDGVLDWVEEGDDAVETDHAVIGGIATRQGHVDPILELRPAIHYPTLVRQPRHSPSGPKKLAEPPAVEGFVTRIKKNGQNERIYLTSHLGAIFRCSPSRAHPPESPGLIPPLPSSHPAPLALVPMIFGLNNIGKSGKQKEKFWRQFADRSGVKQRRGRDWTLKGMEDEEGKLPVVEDEDEQGTALIEAFDHRERRRAFLQITDSQGFISFSEFEVIEPDLVVEPGEQWESTQDPGGHEGMKIAHDSKRLRGLRSFIVKTRAGRKAKFECHSILVRDEWVERLNALIRYWTIRDRADATAQMDLSPSGALVERAQRNGQAPPTREELLSSPLLATMYNWCILDGCRAILLSSTLHIKKELRGTFRKRHVLLLPGTLIEFNSVDRDMYGHPLPSPYHRRKFTLSLRDCYVYSGSLTSSFLAGSTNTAAWEPANGNQHRFPRCYTATDGLRTVDDEEDCTFVIVRTKHGGDGKNKKLNQKGVVRVYRARSKLERDQFVYTLNSAIERLLRSEGEREDRLREFAWLERDKDK
ncbi:hypothetical protein JCM11491_005826 [Sporobolomyces phaffii]